MASFKEKLSRGIEWVSRLLATEQSLWPSAMIGFGIGLVYSYFMVHLLLDHLSALTK